MKETIASALRHAFTALAGLGTYLALHGLIGAADTASVNVAGATIGDALAVVAAALVARLVVWVTGKMGAADKSPLVPVLLVVCGTLAVGGLPACSPDYPISGSLSYRDKRTGAKAGLSYGPDKVLSGGLTVPIYDAQTGELLGMTDVRLGSQRTAVPDAGSGK